MKHLLASGPTRSLAAALAGFVGYGGWAFLVNQSHGFDMGIRAALTQGGYSFVLTLSTTYLMEFLLQQFRTSNYQMQITIAVTITATFCTAYGINYLAGTPEILLTILPGFFIGAAFTVGYVNTVMRMASVRPDAARPDAAQPNAAQPEAPS